MLDRAAPQNKFLYQLLAQLLAGLSILNAEDPELSSIIAQLNAILAPSADASLQDILALINRAQDIVKGYDVKPSDKPSPDPIANLPAVLYSLNQELDHLITREQLLQKSSLQYRVQDLAIKIASFYRKLQ